MKRRKFVNRVDHIVYISRPETVAANIARLEAITGAKLESCDRVDMGCAIHVDWSAGLEMIAPLAERSPVNEAIHARLESHGEGLLAVVYAVADLEATKARLAGEGIELGPLMSGHRDEPWIDRLFLRERFAPEFMDSWMVFSEIDYNEDIVRYVEVAK